MGISWKQKYLRIIITWTHMTGVGNVGTGRGSYWLKKESMLIIDEMNLGELFTLSVNNDNI